MACCSPYLATPAGVLNEYFCFSCAHALVQANPNAASTNAPNMNFFMTAPFRHAEVGYRHFTTRHMLIMFPSVSVPDGIRSRYQLARGSDEVQYFSESGFGRAPEDAASVLGRAETALIRRIFLDQNFTRSIASFSLRMEI